MTDLDQLRAAILANPADYAARLVYADKIQDRDWPGDLERAEFIRVQVELAKLTCNHGSNTNQLLPTPWCPVCVRRQELHECERELAVILDKEFANSVGYWSTDQIPISQGVIVRRGFIAEVRGPLAALVGGECERCHGRGFLGHPAPGQHGYIGAPNCPVCHGTGRTLAGLPAIAKSHPLERVEVVDRRPWQNGYSRKFVWWRESAWSTPNFLFDIIASAHPENVLHPVGPPSHVHIAFDSEHDALAALSRALIAWARKKQP